MVEKGLEIRENTLENWLKGVALAKSLLKDDTLAYFLVVVKESGVEGKLIVENTSCSRDVKSEVALLQTVAENVERMAADFSNHLKQEGLGVDIKQQPRRDVA